MLQSAIQFVLVVIFSTLSASLFIIQKLGEWSISTFTSPKSPSIVLSQNERYLPLKTALNNEPLSLSKSISPPICFAFCGCSWLLTFHLGVAQALKQLESQSSLKFSLKNCVFAGTSSGSLVAAALACNVPLDAFESFAMKMASVATTRFLGPCGQMTNIVSSGLRSLLPPDAYKRASGRLIVSVSTLDYNFKKCLKNYKISDFASNEELISVLLASCYIPGYYEKHVSIPKYLLTKNLSDKEEVLVFDGGATDNIPLPPPDYLLQLRPASPSPVQFVSVNPIHTSEIAAIKPPSGRAYPPQFSLFPTSKEDCKTILEDGFVSCFDYAAQKFGISLQTK